MRLTLALLILSGSLMLISSSPTAIVDIEETYDLENEAVKRQITNLGNSFHVNVDPANITKETAQLVFKMNAYCSCACCIEDLTPDSCDRSHPVELPENFTCPHSFCESHSNLCKGWDEAKCNKACFCKRCANKLAEDDYRCQGNSANSSPGPGCVCEGDELKAPCEPESENLHNLWLATILVSMNPNRVKCLLGCFCTECDREEISAYIPQVDKTCVHFTEIPKKNCTCQQCPSAERAKQALINQNALSISHGGHGK